MVVVLLIAAGVGFGVWHATNHDHDDWADTPTSQSAYSAMDGASSDADSGVAPESDQSDATSAPNDSADSSTERDGSGSDPAGGGQTGVVTPGQLMGMYEHAGLSASKSRCVVNYMVSHSDSFAAGPDDLTMGDVQARFELIQACNLDMGDVDTVIQVNMTNMGSS